MGAQGTYGRFRTVGPIANAFAGLSEMSGLPEPAMPAGWGYSYLDWLGAYSFALAMLSALYHRERTGEGQWIDASQTEVGLFISGTSILDWSANGRIWSRTGNRSPLQAGGAARRLSVRGRGPVDRDRLLQRCRVARADRGRQACRLGKRCSLRDAGRRVCSIRTRSILWSANGPGQARRDQLMLALQKAGVPAGVCQTAGDRCDNDPQLAHLEWLTEVTGTKIGRWPVAEVPVKLSESPAYAGGRIDRGAPCYGEDNEYVYGELLGMTSREIKDLAAEGVF